MNIKPEVLLHMLDDITLQGLRVSHADIVAGLSDDRFEVRNIASILAERRGIQVVNSCVPGQRRDIRWA